jgi:predicted ester cyclase
MLRRMGSDKKLVVRDLLYEKAFNQRDLSVYDRLLSEDILVHDPSVPGARIQGIIAFKKTVNEFFAAFPDIHIDVQFQIAERDKVVSYVNLSGTYKGKLFGTLPTGRRFSSPEVEIVEFRDDKIAEIWALPDTLGMMQQLELIAPKAWQGD